MNQELEFLDTEEYRSKKFPTLTFSKLAVGDRIVYDARWAQQPNLTLLKFLPSLLADKLRDNGYCLEPLSVKWLNPCNVPAVVLAVSEEFDMPHAFVKVGDVEGWICTYKLRKVK